MSPCKKLSTISRLHYLKLVFRSLLFLAAATVYIVRRVRGIPFSLRVITDRPILLGIIAAIFFVEMLFRFFPARFESMGCQKQFKKHYQPQEGEGKKPQRVAWWRTFLSAAFWFALNGTFGVLYYVGIFDEGILVLISLAYGVCDMICVLFFCPFQTWILRSKCCTDCRIYNWDYAMMFTPLVFFINPWGWSILGVSLLLLLEWELLYRFFPQRFTENTNGSLSCANCKEKLCQHKKQLRSYLKKYRAQEKNSTENE